MKHFRTLVLSVLMAALLAAVSAGAAFAAPSSAGNAAAASKGYQDTQGTWAGEQIAQWGDPDIFSTGDGRFYPGRAVTRMEFARLLHDVMNLNINYFAPTDIGTFYDDVSNDEPGAAELYDLTVCGILDPADSFHPSAPLKRDEMTHWLVRAFSYSGSSISLAGVGHEFKDRSEIRAEYRDDAEWAFTLGLIKGRGDNLLDPGADTTRAEAVAVAGRLADLLQKNQVAVSTSAKESNGALTLTLSVFNNTDHTVTISHSSGQTYDFVLLDSAGNELSRWSADRMFPMMVTTTELASGKELVFSATVDAAAYASIRDNIAVMKAYLVGTSSDFTIPADGYLISGVSAET